MKTMHRKLQQADVWIFGWQKPAGQDVVGATLLCTAVLPQI